MALRLVQISNAFKAVFGEANLERDRASAPAACGRLFEWRYGGNWDGETKYTIQRDVRVAASGQLLPLRRRRRLV